MIVTAIAHANIALVKYWGKRDAVLNLPARGSLSLTLDALATTTSVEFLPATAADDSVVIGGVAVDGTSKQRVSDFLDLVRNAADITARAQVVSENNFPTASGLASSASAFAALALAADRAAGLELSEQQLSVLARRGSGSAARSLFPGLVIMHAGARADGSDCYAERLAAVDDSWPLRMVVAVVGGGVKKAVSSRSAMEHAAATSPLYPGWLDSVPGDLVAARSAIADNDIAALGEVVEHSALAMHGSALAARPPIIYFRPTTLACIDAMRELRDSGHHAYCTMDAGPHVKVLTLADDLDAVVARLKAVDGVTRIMPSGPGGAARVVT